MLRSDEQFCVVADVPFACGLAYANGEGSVCTWQDVPLTRLADGEYFNVVADGSFVSLGVSRETRRARL